MDVNPQPGLGRVPTHHYRIEVAELIAPWRCFYRIARPNWNSRSHEATSASLANVLQLISRSAPAVAHPSAFCCVILYCFIFAGLWGGKIDESVWTSQQSIPSFYENQAIQVVREYVACYLRGSM
jgi:hypothetical protein